MLEAARHKSKREVEQQAAALAPKPDVPAVVRRLAQPTATAAALPAAAVASSDAPSLTYGSTCVDTLMPPPGRHVPAVIAPLAPERYRVHLTIGRDTHDKLRRIQDLLRHVVANGDPAIIFDRALTLLLDDLERRRLSKVDRPRPTQAANPRGRHVAANVKRNVWVRDGGRCAFVGTDGRCLETGFLELHHVVPFADGGPTTVDNLQLRCRAHNAYEAKEYFGSMLFREHSIRYELVPERVRCWHKIGAASATG